MSQTLIGLGEALFDVFGDEARLGGAPLNVATHAHRMLQPGGGRGLVMSRVGDDPLGRRLLEELLDRGMPVAGVQVDPERPTGRVRVERTDSGGHAFHLLTDQAYDRLEATEALRGLAREADAVAFGSLAQRSSASRAAIRSLVNEARASGAVALFDVNLRASDGQRFYDDDTLRWGVAHADYVKLNDEELDTVLGATGDADAAALVTSHGLRGLVYTRGADGTAFVTADGVQEGEPAEVTDPHPDADTVGAGDSCAAAFLVATLRGAPPAAACTLANRVAAFVAGRPGATPPLPEDLLA